MSEKQRKHRIKTYWKKAKRVFLFQRLKLADEKFQKNKEINQEDDGDDILENINSSAEHEWKWYIIRQENTLPQIWSFLTNMLTIYALFVTPFVLVFSDCSRYLENFELFVDICFSIDIILNFFKLKES